MLNKQTLVLKEFNKEVVRMSTSYNANAVLAIVVIWVLMIIALILAAFVSAKPGFGGLGTHTFIVSESRTPEGWRILTPMRPITVGVEVLLGRMPKPHDVMKCEPVPVMTQASRPHPVVQLKCGDTLLLIKALVWEATGL